MKPFLIAPYYAATWPWRLIRNARDFHHGRAPIMVVYYHRVADDNANSWTISNRQFRRHIRWLRKHFDLIGLDGVRRRLMGSGLHRPAVSITFDDGYAENCEAALPWLIENRIPCTYFVTAHNIFTGEPFPHDVAMGNRFAPNTVEQLRQLSAAGIEIGAHTRTHADLGATGDRDVLADEIIAATEELAEAVGQRMRFFAFPFGMKANLQPAAFELARLAGFDAVCSAYGGYNRPGDDPFHLQRFGGEGPLIRLKNWTTVDPIKERRITRYDYRLAKEESRLPDPVGVS